MFHVEHWQRQWPLWNKNHAKNAMQAAAKFPLDLTELSVFRALKEPLGGTDKAIHYFWLLWRDLAQLVSEGGPLGRMRPTNAQAFIGLTVERGFFDSAAAASEFFNAQVVGSGLLQKDGEEFTCPRFIILNPELANKPREQRGGHGRSFALKQEKMEKRLMELSLNLKSSIFVYPGGEPLPSDLVERVSRLIYSCDNALKKDRPTIGWTEGLVTLALPVVEKYTDEQIGYVCRKVALNYGHAALLNMTTEKLLPKFSTIMSEIGDD